jgi:hypothetical protein
LSPDDSAARYSSHHGPDRLIGGLSRWTDHAVRQAGGSRRLAGLFGTQRGGVNGGATFTLTSAYTPYHTHDFSMTASGSSSANGAHNHVYDKQIDSEFGGINVLYPDNMPRFQFNWSGGDDSSSAAFAETRSSGTSLAVYRSTTHDTGDHTHSWSGGVSGNMYWESPGGAASAFSILPPHVTVNYIIKT